MLIINKMKPIASSILSKIAVGLVLFDLSLFNIWSIFDYDVINMKSQDHKVKVYDVIDNVTPQYIFDVIINV